MVQREGEPVEKPTRNSLQGNEQFTGFHSFPKMGSRREKERRIWHYFSVRTS
jgi:hypothetical protein